MSDVYSNPYGVISDEQPGEQPLVTDVQETPTPPQDLVFERAQKYDFALGFKSPGKDHLVTVLNSGQEGSFREQAAEQQKAENRKLKTDLILDLARRRQGSVSETEAAFLEGLTKHPDNLDPETYIEQEFGRQYINAITDFPGMRETLEPAKAANFPAVLDLMDLYSGATARREYLLKQYQDAKTQWGKEAAQPYGLSPLSAVPFLGPLTSLPYSKGVIEAGKSVLIPFHSWANFLIAANDAPGRNLFPGQLIAAKVRQLHAMNMDDMKIEYKKTFDELYSRAPLDALHFAQAMVHFSTSDEFLANLSGFAELALSLTFIAPRALPVRTLQQAQLPAETVKQLQVLMAPITAAGRLDQTVLIPRGLTPAEINNVKSGLAKLTGTPVKEVTPRLLTDSEKEALVKFAPRAKITEAAEPRPLTIQELQRAAEAVPAREFTAQELAGVRANFLQLENTLRSGMVGLRGENFSISQAMDSVGQLRTAATLDAVREVQNVAAGREQFDGFGGLQNRLWSIFDFNQAARNPGTYSLEAQRRLMQVGETGAKVVLDAYKSAPKIARGPEEALLKGFQEAETRFRDSWPYGRASVLSVQYERGANNLPNINRIWVDLGDKNGEVFLGQNAWSRANAHKNLIYKLPDATIEPHGGGFVLRVTKPVDETTNFFRDGLINPENALERNWFAAALGYLRLRSADDLTSTLNTKMRYLAQHVSAEVQHALKELAKPLTQLSKTEYQELATFVDANRTWINPETGRPGRYFDTLGDMEVVFRTQFNKNATESQAQAYFTVRQLYDFDYIVRAQQYEKNLSRQGIEQFSFKFTAPETETDPSQVIKTDFILGKRVDSLPSTSGDINKSFGVYVYDPVLQTGRYYRPRDLSREAANNIDELVKSGYRIIQLYRPIDRPLAGVAPGAGNDTVNFVVTRDVTSKPVSAQLVPYHEGSRLEYATPYYIKQGIVDTVRGTQRYFGDRTVLGHRTEAAANQYTKALEEARVLYNARDEAALRAHLARTLPFEYEEIVRRFASGNWDPKIPFVMVPSGDSTFAKYPKQFKDVINEFDSPFNLSRYVDQEFLGSRDPLLQTITTRGSEYGPQLKLENAPLIDFSSTLGNTVSRIANEKTISDYRILSVESWIQRVIDHNLMDVSEEALRQSPMYWYHNPKWRKDITQLQAREIAKVEKTSIDQFLGAASPDVQVMKWAQEKVLNSTHALRGQASSDYWASHLRFKSQDPTTFLRAATFDIQMGSFNPVQYFNQSQTVLHAVAVAGPTNGWNGFTAGSMKYTLRGQMNEKIRHAAYEHMLATKSTGWNLEWLKESDELFSRSGWGRIGGEVTWRSDVESPQIVQSAFGKIREGGRFFFNEGEKLPRYIAWDAAYYEWRSANPTAKATDEVIAGLLNRANIMTNNMTRAAHAGLQQGIPSMTTQFLGYQMRLMDQIWGGRLTWQEKSRVMALYSALYGIPVGVSVPIGLWPMYDQMKEWSIRMGVNWDDNIATRILGEGLGNEFWTQATGGKKYDFSSKFGPRGIPNIRDWLLGDKTMMEIIWGVSGTTFEGIGRSLQPFIWGLAAAVQGKHKDYPIMMSDLEGVSKVISTVNTEVRAVYAWNYQKYYTRSNRSVAEADKLDAILLGVFGVQSRKAQEAMTLEKMVQRQERGKAALLQIIRVDYRNFFNAVKQNDKASSDGYIKRLQQYRIIGGFTPTEWNSISVKATNDYKDIAVTAPYNWFIKDAPPSQAKQRMKTFDERQK